MLSHLSIEVKQTGHDSGASLAGKRRFSRASYDIASGQGIEVALKRASPSKTVDALIFIVSPIPRLFSFWSNLSRRILKQVSMELPAFLFLDIDVSVGLKISNEDSVRKR